MKASKLKRYLRILIAASLAFSAMARATSFIERPFPNAVKDAPFIVKGRVGQVYTDWVKTPDGTRRIYTFCELQVEEVVKGKISQIGSSIVMREMGGEKDGIGMQVSGSAQFARGEPVVVFVREKNKDGTFDLEGMMMGKYIVEKDSSGKEYLSGPGLFERPSGHDHGAQSDNHGQDDTHSEKKWYLTDLRQLVAAQANDPSEPNAQSQKPKPLPSVTSPEQGLSSSSQIAKKQDVTSASSLQISTEEEGNSQEGAPVFLYLGLGITVIVIAGFFLRIFLRK